MADNVTMTFGGYSFSPVPSMTYSRNAERTVGENFCLSTPVTVNLDGSIVATGFQSVVDATKTLSDQFKCGDCQDFVVRCGTNDPFISGLAKVINFDVKPRNDADLYVNTSSYTITLEMVSLSGETYDNQPSGISAISEDWSFEFFDERVGGSVDGLQQGSIDINSAYTITHNVSITAPFQCKDGSDIIGWQQAAEYIQNNLVVINPEDGITGLFLPSNNNYYNHFRVMNKNIHEGTVTMNETWLATPSGALEEFNVDMTSSLDSDLTQVVVNGTIQGLAEVSYPDATGRPKIENAFDYWKNIVSGNVLARAQTIYDGARSLNNVPLSKSLGYSNVAGVVTYSYTYDDRPINCLSDAKAERITITENEPNDVFTSLTVLGRLAGPLHQDVNTSGARTREISIESILPVDTGCSYNSFKAPTGYDDLISTYEAGLIADYSQVFINNETKSWNPKDGRFTYTKGWTVGGC